MMTPLVVVGAGGFGRETVELVRAINAVSPRFDLRGFVDDDAALIGGQRVGLSILGPLAWLAEHDDVTVVACVGSPSSIGLRRRVVERLGLPPRRYATLVHPAAVVSPSVALGVGTIIHATSVCTADITIGAHVAMMPGVVLTHDDVVGDFVTFGAGARLAGSVSVGPDAYLGSSAVVRERLEIGATAIVGMGAVVTTSIPAGQVWAGNPARFLRLVGEWTAVGSVSAA